MECKSSRFTVTIAPLTVFLVHTLGESVREGVLVNERGRGLCE